jgi:CubicO group peptidase (beta-lactamase class C family)
MKTLTVLFCFLIGALTAHSQNMSAHLTRQLDSLIQSRYSAVAPGCVVLVAEKGGVIYRKAFGVADLKTKAPVQPDMIFRLGSMSKQYTGIAILQLIEQGKIKLQDSIQIYVKDFPHKAYPVTIENLLSQTSGIINFQDIQNPAPKKVHDNYTPAQGVDYFKDEPLKFKPGSRFEYSNSNFFLLGYIIELVTGQTYGDYVGQHLLALAGLQHTLYLRPGLQIPNMASGYSRFNHKRWEDAELQNVTMLYAAGGIAANADDVWKWHQALTSGELISQPLLERAYTAFIPTNGPPQYGYGWFIKEIDGLKTIEHSGSTDGYQSNELYLPEKDLFVTALFNGFETNMDWQILTNDIARLALGNGLRKILKLNDDSLKRFTGTYEYTKEHRIIITFKDHQLFVVATNPKDRLPELPLFAQSATRFYINEAPLQFEFVTEKTNQQYKLVTYNASGKDAEWKKVR